MSKKRIENVFCPLALVGTGLAAGLAAGMCAMMPKTQPSAALVERCRRAVEAVDSLPEAEYRRFWEVTVASPSLTERWAITRAIAEIKLAGENPAKHVL